MTVLLSSNDILNHFQRGGGPAIFHGQYVNSKVRGRGLGNILSSISKIALPILKRVVVPHAKKALIGTASDVLSGRNLATSLKTRAKDAGKAMIKTAFQPPTNRGVGKRKNIKRRVVGKQKYRDIFN